MINSALYRIKKMCSICDHSCAWGDHCSDRLESPNTCQKFQSLLLNMNMNTTAVTCWFCLQQLKFF